jgi:acetoin utilization deacetylase AcuC-like enzyme
MRCFYHADYFLPLPEGHPFPMEKFPEAHALVKEHVQVEPPLLLARADIERVHLATYLDAVSFDLGPNVSTGLIPYDRNRLGLPANPRLLERSMLETAGTVSAMLAALADGISANLAGGTHHAFPGQGLGYCVLNDIAVAIEYLRVHRPGAADCILIVDTDAHQGNANHAYFRDDPSVFTYSIHVGRNYPAKKEPGDCDVPLPRYVSGRAYLDALTQTLPPILKRLEPDLIFWISGADCHENDRFGQMQLSDAEMAERDRCVLRWCAATAAPIVVVYGGGYNRTPGKTGWLHAQSILAAARNYPWLR